MKSEPFTMVAKTMKGLEATLADELRRLGADNVEPGHRMVSFEGDLEMLYRANLCLRTALRVLKPFYTFEADDPDTLYDRMKAFDWSTIMSPSSTFAIDMVMNSDSFTHSRFATYRAKDAIVDWFMDRKGSRPGIRLDETDIMINIHIQGNRVTVSLDSSGQSLHKRGWRVASTQAPINEVLAAGILLMSGYDGSQPLVDPMCGSGTFLVEAALIAANINPGVFRRKYAFQNWPDYDEELFESLWNNDSAERTPANIIKGADILPAAVEATSRNLKAAGVAKFVEVEVRRFSEWMSAPAPSGILVMNPPYGRRISAPDMEELYAGIGRKLKLAFTGWTAWIISSTDEFFNFIGLAPSRRVELFNGAIDCQLREYVMFAGNKKEFRQAGGRLKTPSRSDDGKPRGKGREKGPRKAKPQTERAEKAAPRFDKPFDRHNRQTEEKRFERHDAAPADSENPRAARRNVEMLNSIMNSAPAAPRLAPTVMRSRNPKKKS